MTILQARMVRDALRLSLQDVSRLTSIGLSNLGRFERSEEQLSLRKLRELAALYSAKAGRVVTIDELVAEVEPAQEVRP